VMIEHEGLSRPTGSKLIAHDGRLLLTSVLAVTVWV
jgi:hypothetical protein